MNKKYFLYFYVFITHIILITLIIKFNLLNTVWNKDVSPLVEWQRTQQVMHSFNLRVDKNTSKGKVIFIGDSHIQGLAVNEVSIQGVNFGIGRDTSKIILSRINQYQSIKSASAVVLAFGINDFQYRSIEETLKNYKAILEIIPKKTLIVINAVFNVDTAYLSIQINNKDIRIFNRKLERLSKEYGNSFFLNINPQLTKNTRLLDRYHIGDGLHLNKRGYQVWIKELHKLLNKEIK